MTRRIVAVALALVLGLVGVTTTLRYVARADARAMAGMAATDVLVVSQPIPEGTPGSQIAASVTLRELPATAVVPGAVASLDLLGDRVATASLQVGEQVLANRFADPQSLGRVPVPKGLQEVTLSLEPQRVVGGNLAVGDTVGVFLSTTEDPKQTHLGAGKVLVTRFAGGPAKPEGDGSSGGLGGGGSGAADAPYLVTLAVTARQAERVVWTAEHGKVWLSAEPATTDNRGTTVVDAGSLYR